MTLPGSHGSHTVTESTVTVVTAVVTVVTRPRQFLHIDKHSFASKKTQLPNVILCSVCEKTIWKNLSHVLIGNFDPFGQN